MEYGGDDLLLLKKEVSHELRRELKEMFFIEWMKHESLTPRRRAPVAGGTPSTETEPVALDASLETLAKLLEENMSKVRQDLRLLTQKIESAEASVGRNSRSRDPISLSVSLPFLPPPGHRSIPSPLHLDVVNSGSGSSSSSNNNASLYLNLPAGKSGKRNMSIVLPSELLVNSLELSQDPPAPRSAREHTASSRRAYSCDQLEESGTLSESLTFDEDEDDEDNPMERSCLPDEDQMGEEMADEVVTLNVGGRTFQTYRETLLRLPESLLGRYVTSEHYAKEKKENASRSRPRDVFFDRNTTAFEAILDCYRTGLLLKPPELHEEIWKLELGYWDIVAEKGRREKKRDKRDKTVVKRKTKKKRASTKDKIDIETPVSPPGGRSWEESDLPRTKKERNRLNALVRGRPASLKDVSLKVKETRKDKRTLSTVDLPSHAESKKKKEKYIITTAPNIDIGGSDSAWSRKKNRRSGSAYDLGLQVPEKPEKQSKKEKRELSNRSLT